MVSYQVLMVSRQAIERPVGGRDVRVVIGTINALRGFLVPTGPGCPVEILAVKIRRHLIRLIEEETLLDSELEWAFAVLQLTPENAIKELMVLLEFVLIGFNELLHHRRQPRSSPAFVAQPGNPDPAVLQDDLIGVLVVGHYRRTAVEGVVGIDEPLLGGQ